MNIWVFLPLLLVGLGTLIAGAVSMVMGRRRHPIMLPIGGAIIAGAVVAGALIPDGANAEASSVRSQPAQFAFSYPAEAEELDAQDFLLEGNGPAGESLTVLRNGETLNSITVAADNRWSYYVQAPAVGEYEFEIKSPSESLKRKVIVKQGLISASNAQCPCRLRILTNEKQNIANATVTLFKDGVEVAQGTAPFVFSNLETGQYTYTVVAEGFSAVENKAAETPKNKNISVYLDPQK